MGNTTKDTGTQSICLPARWASQRHSWCHHKRLACQGITRHTDQSQGAVRPRRSWPAPGPAGSGRARQVCFLLSVASWKQHQSQAPSAFYSDSPVNRWCRSDAKGCCDRYQKVFCKESSWSSSIWMSQRLQEERSLLSNRWPCSGARSCRNSKQEGPPTIRTAKKKIS